MLAALASWKAGLLEPLRLGKAAVVTITYTATQVKTLIGQMRPVLEQVMLQCSGAGFFSADMKYALHG